MLICGFAEQLGMHDIQQSASASGLELRDGPRIENLAGSRTERSAIIEIVGPAGAGKSSLVEELCRRDGSIEKASRLKITAPRHLPFVLVRGALMLPRLLFWLRLGRVPSREEFKRLIYLEGWHRVLLRQAADPGQVVVLDQGPVYYSAALYSFGPAILRQSHFASWWSEAYRRWRGVLDLIVWLDAPRETLVSRINARGKPHSVKGRSSEEATAYIRRYRTALDGAVDRLTGERAVRVLRFDTSVDSLETIASRVVASLAHEPRPHPSEASEP